MASKLFIIFCESLPMVYPVEHSSNPFRYHAFIEFYFRRPSSRCGSFRGSHEHYAADQGNKEKIERVMNSIELALLDLISQPLPFRLEGGIRPKRRRTNDGKKR
ncbi:hypothetical protein H5410_064142 [Solanum commersonii]|uniref:Uncharacterized protein n=1 Tax=Solanum commersonii TaxID=4109 RepID=A0A9J5W036_SOLCO|nr:hypothetical protein H5410_064142 [Solanum commersonii]